MKKMNALQRRRELDQTAASVNALPRQQRIELGQHLLAKYRSKMIQSTIDRVEALARGYKIDRSLVGLIEDAGIQL